VGSLVTIYAAASMSTANITIVSTSTGGQVAFNSLGGTQKLVLSPTTVGAGEDMSVTLIGDNGAFSMRGRALLRIARLTAFALQPKL
jgi:hypothetical protein